MEPSRYDGLAQLHQRYYPELVRLAFALTGDWSLAEELDQEAPLPHRPGIEPRRPPWVPFRGAPMAIAAGPAGLWVVFANANHTSQQLVHLVLDSGPN